jgi:predicted DNA-binding protein (MmcQ/YjbR family)
VLAVSREFATFPVREVIDAGFCWIPQATRFFPNVESGSSMNPHEIDKVLERVRSLCLALPESCEVEAWGHPTFRAGKRMFATFGGEPEEATIHLKMSFERQDELLNDQRFFPTPYSARLGWVSLRLDRKTDWNEVRELVREAYREVALKRMLKALEAG